MAFEEGTGLICGMPATKVGPHCGRLFIHMDNFKGQVSATESAAEDDQVVTQPILKQSVNRKVSLSG